MNTTSGASINDDTHLWYLGKAFDEFTVTGDNYGTLDNPQTPISSIYSPAGDSNRWFKFTIPAADMSSFISGSKANYGFTLHGGTDMVIRERSFHSREYADTALRPKITLIYDMAEYVQTVAPSSQALRPDSTYPIIWYSNSAAPFMIELLKGGVVVDTIDDNITESPYNWKVAKHTYASGTDYTVRVSSNSVASSNDPTFEIISFTPVLTVTGGTGSGAQVAASTVAISGTNSEPGVKEFIAWRGDVATINDTLSETTTLTMPDQDITIEAVYDFIAIDLPGKLEAESPQAKGGYWSVDSDPQYGGATVAGNGVNSDSTGFWISYKVRVAQAGNYQLAIRVAHKSSLNTMRIENVDAQSVLARYSLQGTSADWYTFDNHIKTIALPQGSYTLRFYVYASGISGWFNLDYLDFSYLGTANILTVNGGSGSGSASQGEQVSITANTPAAGKGFLSWIGDTAYVDDPSSASTTVTMPDSSITITALYDNIVPLEFESRSLLPTSYKAVIAGRSLQLSVPASANNKPVTIHLYNVKGSRVATLVNKPYSAGVHMIEIGNAIHSLAKGLYIMHVQAGSIQKSYRVPLQ